MNVGPNATVGELQQAVRTLETAIAAGDTAIAFGSAVLTLSQAPRYVEMLRSEIARIELNPKEVRRRERFAMKQEGLI